MSLALLESPTRRDSSRHLSAREERLLAIRIKSGDRQAVERLALANLNLVGHVARMFEGLGLSIEDLKQEGIQGLLRACADFNPESHDVRFSSYAVFGIRNAIQQAVANHGALIRLPDHMIRLRAKYRRTVGDLQSEEYENGGAKSRPNPQEIDNQIAARLGITQETLDLVRQTEFERADFYGGDDNDEEAAALEDMITDDRQPLLDLDSVEELDCLREGIELLAPHEAWIVKYRFGLGESPADRPRSVQWIARAHRIAPETIRRIEKAAMIKLKTHLRKRLGEIDE